MPTSQACKAAALLQKLEVGAYDGFLTGYQQAAVDTERVSALLNAGQVLMIARRGRQYHRVCCSQH